MGKGSRLLVVDTTPAAYSQQPAVQVELMADVLVRCPDTGEQLKLERGRIVVIEQSALSGPTPRGQPEAGQPGRPPPSGEVG